MYDFDGFLSDSDQSHDGVLEWRKKFGRRNAERPRVLRGTTLLEVVNDAIRQNVHGKYGNWEEYLRFLHRHSKRCRPPPGRAPEQQTPFLLRNFLKSLHDIDRTGDVQTVIKANDLYS